jgi:hypothetical protein
MKRFLLIQSILILTSCSNKIPDGTYRGINYNNNSLAHIEQYFTFDGNQFGKYIIRHGEKFVYDSINIIKYSGGNNFSLIRNDTIYKCKYFIKHDTLKLEINENIITLLKVSPKP